MLTAMNFGATCQSIYQVLTYVSAVRPAADVDSAPTGALYGADVNAHQHSALH